MRMSDKIESFILELMKQEQEDWLKIQRNELAQIFGCVPSQINYVLQTRFSPEKGYLVDSQRGGGGCVRIRRVQPSNNVTAIYIMPKLTEREAIDGLRMFTERGNITNEQAQVIAAAISDEALINVNSSSRDTVRSDILKKCLKTLLGD